MTYIDTSKAAGAALRYPKGIPTDSISPRKTSVTKKEFLWSRIDVYFYPSTNY